MSLPVPSTPPGCRPWRPGTTSAARSFVAGRAATGRVILAALLIPPDLIILLQIALTRKRRRLPPSAARHRVATFPVHPLRVRGPAQAAGAQLPVGTVPAPARGTLPLHVGPSSVPRRRARQRNRTAAAAAVRGIDAPPRVRIVRQVRQGAPSARHAAVLMARAIFRADPHGRIAAHVAPPADPAVAATVGRTRAPPHVEQA